MQVYAFIKLPKRPKNQYLNFKNERRWNSLGKILGIIILLWLKWKEYQTNIKLFLHIWCHVALYSNFRSKLHMQTNHHGECSAKVNRTWWVWPNSKHHMLEKKQNLKLFQWHWTGKNWLVMQKRRITSSNWGHQLLKIHLFTIWVTIATRDAFILMPNLHHLHLHHPSFTDTSKKQESPPVMRTTTASTTTQSAPSPNPDKCDKICVVCVCKSMTHIYVVWIWPCQKIPTSCPFLPRSYLYQDLWSWRCHKHLWNQFVIS